MSVLSSAKIRGAVSAAIGVVLAGSLFYPVLHLAGGGGDVDHPLYVDLVLGAIGGIWASPVAAGVGAAYGARFGDYLTPGRCAGLIGLGAFLSTLPWVLLGALRDPTFLWIHPMLGALAVVIGLMVFSFRPKSAAMG